MAVWDTDEAVVGQPPVAAATSRDIWRAADKIVYSTTLPTVTTGRTRLERAFDPSAIQQLKAVATRNIGIGGPALAAHTIRADLVDEYHLYVNPIVVGGGKPALPDDVRVQLDLIDERRFGGGVVFLRYRTLV